MSRRLTVSKEDPLVELERDGLVNLLISGSAPATPIAKTLYEDSLVKAWLGWTYSAGAPVIDDEMNITTLDDDGTGDIGVNFATAMATANNWAVLGCGGQSDCNVMYDGRSASAVEIITEIAGTNTPSDRHGCIAVIGNN